MRHREALLCEIVAIVFLVTGCGSPQRANRPAIAVQITPSPASEFFERTVLSGLVAQPQESVWLLRFSREWNRGDAWVAEYSPCAMRVVQLRYEPDADSLELVGAWAFEMGQARWDAIRTAFRDAPTIWGDREGRSSSNVGFAGIGSTFRDTEILDSALELDTVCERLSPKHHLPADDNYLFKSPRIEGLLPWMLSRYYSPPAIAEPPEDGVTVEE